MDNGIVLKKLTIEDYEKIVSLWKEAGLPFKPKGRDSKEAIKRQMEENPEFFLGAFMDDELVGVVIGSYDGRMKGWINRLAVSPRFRGRGIAKMLVCEMERILSSKGAKIFCVLVEKPNPASINLFKKLGYALHENIVYMTKRESQEV